MLLKYIKSDGQRQLFKIDGNLTSCKDIQLMKNNMIPELDDDEIFSRLELPVVYREEHSRVCQIKLLPYWKIDQLRALT